jgi:hypothetical protein
MKNKNPLHIKVLSFQDGKHVAFLPNIPFAMSAMGFTTQKILFET